MNVELPIWRTLYDLLLMTIMYYDLLTSCNHTSGLRGHYLTSYVPLSGVVSIF